MPKKMPESFNYLSNNPEYVADPEIEEFMEGEIAHAPKDPDLLAQRLRNHAASPADASGDTGADWADVDQTDTDAAAGDSPSNEPCIDAENATTVGASSDDYHDV